MTIAKYLHALNILYEHQEWELKIWTIKLKEAEVEAQALRIDVLMINSQLLAMREEKEQNKQELQKALERPQQKKRSEKRKRRAY